MMTNNINALNDQTTATKSIIDLICRIPDDFANVTKIFIFYKQNAHKVNIYIYI